MPLEKFSYKVQQRVRRLGGDLEESRSLESSEAKSPLMLLLTPMQIYRQYFYKQQARQIHEAIDTESSILDVGSGVGYFAHAIKQEIPEIEIVCTDIENSNRSAAPFVLADGKSLPFQDDSFDVVTMFYVLHHTDDPQLMLREARRVSRNKVIIHEDTYTNRLEKWAYKRHINNFVAKNPHAGISLVRTDSDWEKMFEDEGFILTKKREVFRLSYPATRIEYQLLVPPK